MKWFSFLVIRALATGSSKWDGVAYLIDPRGSYEKLDFEYGHSTEVLNSCSLQWHNHYYVFGGRTQYNRNQVSLVIGNELVRTESLGFAFYDGTCTILNQNTIVLCFRGGYEREDRGCRQSNHPLGPYNKLRDSNHDHHGARIASFDGKK